MAGRRQRATSFGLIAEDYDRVRPTPPAAAIDWLVPERCQLAVDLGAGTGLFTRALARRAAQVIAVEPDARMRAVLAARSPGVRVIEGWAEAIPLPGASADGVFVSSAWHWLDPEQAVPEIARVLRDGGRLGVIWTSRDREVEWIRDLDLLRGPAFARPEAEATAPGGRGREIRLPGEGPFVTVTRRSFAFVRTMTVDDIVAMLGTYSGVITAAPSDAAAGLAQARRALNERFPGAEAIDVPMRAWCWRMDRVPRT